MAGDQHACTRTVVETTPDAAVVANLGLSAYILADVEDRERNFYQWGSMGSTTAIGLGLALATDEQVTALEGDGGLLMSLGILRTVAACDPSNLVVVLWENEVYSTTGSQETYAPGTDFVAVAAACDLPATRVETDEAFVDAYADAVERDGAELVVCAVEDTETDARPPFDYAHIKRRVRDSLVADD